MAWSVQWRGLLLMLSTLAAGVLFATGHHLFYQSLNGQEAPSGSYMLGSWSYSKQETNIQIGTLLATLTKTCFVIAAGISYFHIFWQPAVYGRSIKVQHLDAMYSVLDNFFYLFYVRIW